MSAQKSSYSGLLSLLEAFRFAAWGKNPFIKESTRADRTVKYLDFGMHLRAVQSFCEAVEGKLVVFEQYSTAVEEFEKQGVVYKKGACIIGQPGIGKTCFIPYAVTVRLLEKRPVAVEVSWSKRLPQYILFTESDVTLWTEEDTAPLLRHPGLWAFSDSNDDVLYPIVAFRKRFLDVRVFQTTSPAEPRWKEWTKQRRVRLYTMDLPSIEEIEDVAIVLGKHVSTMKALAEKWGPVPRILLQILENPGDEEAYETKVTKAVSKATTEPESVLDAITSHNSSQFSGSSLVFFTTPISITSRQLLSVYVPTPWLADQLVKGLFHHDEDQRDGFFRIMSCHPRAHSTIGWMFESVAHRFLAREIFTITWSDGVIDTVSQGLLRIHSVDGDLKGLDPPYYWLPAVSNFPGIDAAIVTTDHVFAIQSTVQFKHGTPIEGLKKLRLKFPEGSPMRDWPRYKVLFVGSSDEQAQSVRDQHAGNLKAGCYSIPVGCLTVPMGPYCRQFFVSCELDRRNLLIHVFCVHGPGLETAGAEAGTGDDRMRKSSWILKNESDSCLDGTIK